MRIGQLAKLAGVSVRAIRHYDSVGLLRPDRGHNGYRDFSDEDVERVGLIQALLGVGFRLEEIRDHAPCWLTTAPLRDVSKQHSADFLRRKLAELDERVAMMNAIRARLQSQLQSMTQDKE